MFEMFRDDQVVSGFQVECSFLKLDGRGALEKSDPFGKVLIVPEIGRT